MTYNINKKGLITQEFTKRPKFITGFTLIELLVALSIIGVMTSVVIASVNDARAKARDAQRITEIKNLQNALLLYFSENNEQFPPHTGESVMGGNTLRLYTSIWGTDTENVFESEIEPFMQNLPEPDGFINPNKPGFMGGPITTSRVMYRRLTNNTVAGCSGIRGDCYALVVYPETNNSWGSANTAGYFLSNGEIRQGFDNNLF